MKTIFHIHGPVIGRKLRSAEITITKHSKTCSVKWSVGEIDISGAASDKFSERLQRSGMMEEIQGWWKWNNAHLSNRSHLFGCVRWGAVKYIPPSISGELVMLIRKHYQEAVKNLPTRYCFDFVEASE